MPAYPTLTRSEHSFPTSSTPGFPQQNLRRLDPLHNLTMLKQVTDRAGCLRGGEKGNLEVLYPHCLSTQKSGARAMGSCLISECPLTCPDPQVPRPGPTGPRALCYAKGRQLMDSCLGLLRPRAQAAAVLQLHTKLPALNVLLNIIV